MHAFVFAALPAGSFRSVRRLGCEQARLNSNEHIIPLVGFATNHIKTPFLSGTLPMKSTNAGRFRYLGLYLTDLFLAPLSSTSAFIQERARTGALAEFHGYSRLLRIETQHGQHGQHGHHLVLTNLLSSYLSSRIFRFPWLSFPLSFWKDRA
ncbi:hypothetical protein TWF217_001629 [Orbilia oligospora]|nr:hypothetical protein TWF217_001629 [Orbilia oligospora]